MDVDSKNSLHNLGKLIGETGDKKSQSLISRAMSIRESAVRKQYNDIRKILENGKFSPIHTFSINVTDSHRVSSYRVSHDNENYYYGDSGNLPGIPDDTYKDIAKLALANERNKQPQEIENESTSIKNEEDIINEFVGDDLAKIEKTSQYLRDTRSYVDESGDKKTSKKYAKSYQKKMNGISELKKIYHEIAKIKFEKSKIEAALSELLQDEKQGNNKVKPQLNSKETEKIRASLEAYKEKLEKQLSKLEAKVSKTISKNGLETSMDNAERYTKANEELARLNEFKTDIDNSPAIVNLREKLSKAKQKLNEIRQENDGKEKAHDGYPGGAVVEERNGDFYETGEIDQPSSGIDRSEEKAMEAEIARINKQIQEQEAIIRQKEEKRRKLESQRKDLMESEVLTTTRKSKQSQLLPVSSVVKPHIDNRQENTDHTDNDNPPVLAEDRAKSFRQAMHVDEDKLNTVPTQQTPSNNLSLHRDDTGR